MNQKAYSLLEIKQVNDEERTIRGIASTPTPDRSEDVVNPQGAKFKLPLPLLWQHDHSKPIGQVVEANVTANGIEIVAKIAKDVSDEIDGYWRYIKSGLVRGLSIGFRGLDVEPIKGSYGVTFKAWEWYELSAVTVPANEEASITSIKKFDNEAKAASGKFKLIADCPNGSDPGVTGNNQQTIKIKTTPKGDHSMATKSIAEQINEYNAVRHQKAAQMAAIMEKSAENGETLDADEKEQFDTLDNEINACDDHIKRLEKMQNIAVATAIPVNQIKTQGEGTQARSFATVKATKLPAGTAFTRYAMSLAKAKGNIHQALELAKNWSDSTPEVESVLKAAVSAGTTTDETWAKPLVEYTNMTNEFIELLRPATVLGKISNLRRVPFNVTLPGQTAGSSVQWVGEGKSKPVSKLAFETTKIGFAKIAGIVVLTDELVRFSNPAAEALVRQDLIDTIAGFTDTSFLDPTKAEVANVAPASITNGASTVAASGKTADNLRTDIKALMAKFLSANMSTSGAVWIMSEQLSTSIGLITNALGAYEFPNMTEQGGTLLGKQVITSEAVPVGMMILAKPSEIFLADDGMVTLDASGQASIEMSDTPDGTGTLVSLWQNNMLGLRAERFINWKRRRPQAVAYITGADYGGVA